MNEFLVLLAGALMLVHANRLPSSDHLVHLLLDGADLADAVCLEVTRRRVHQFVDEFLAVMCRRYIGLLQRSISILFETGVDVGELDLGGFAVVVGLASFEEADACLCEGAVEVEVADAVLGLDVGAEEG